MKKPKMPKLPEPTKITPMPDISGAQVSQAKYDALRKIMSMRGRSATLITNARRKLGGDLSGRLSDVPDGGRARAEVTRG